MKFLFSTLLFLLLSAFGSAQNEGNVWMLGYSGANPCYKTGFDFNSGQLDTFSLCRPMGFFLTNSSICDENGQLLFYTNGYQIANKYHDSLPGSTGFNPSATNPSQIRLNIDQGTLILPVPESDSLFYLFHVNAEWLGPPSPEAQPLELRCTMIDMSLDSGRGDVVSTHFNRTIYEDTLVLGRLTATKHSNGTDWWLVSHRFYNDEYLIFKVTNDSIYAPIVQRIGRKFRGDIIGRMVFSQDGSKLAVTGWDYFIDVLDFDRCSGTLSNPETILKFDTSFTYPDTALLNSCAFSSSGRFLYFNSKYNLYQVDLHASSIQNSTVRIDEWNGEFSPSQT